MSERLTPIVLTLDEEPNLARTLAALVGPSGASSSTPVVEMPRRRSQGAFAMSSSTAILRELGEPVEACACPPRHRDALGGGAGR